MSKKLFHIFLLLFLIGPGVYAQQKSVEKISGKADLIKKPKLVLVLVYDQFRADMLTRYHKLFEAKGFRYLLENGAYYPYAEYEVLQCMTCPGHAMILTGSYPYNNGIPLNDWFDYQKNKMVYCSEDAEFGVSPRRLKGTTVGDELKMVSAESKVVAIAIKDRASIMLGGHAANISLWLNNEKMEWETSAFYKNTGDLEWLKKWNQKVSPLKDTESIFQGHYSKAKFNYKWKSNTNDALGSPFGTQLTNSLALETIKQMKLGQGPSADLLAVSFSSHDLAGHKFGPDSEETKEMTLAEDHDLGELLEGIDKTVGLKNTWIVFTADHGVAPTEEYAKRHGLDAGRIDVEKYTEIVNVALEKQFGQAGVGKKWIVDNASFNFYFSKNIFENKSATEKDILSYAKSVLKQQPGVLDVMTRVEYFERILPAEMHGRQMMKSYIPFANGDLVMIPRPHWYQKSKNTATHMTGYSYDRTVPLIFVGNVFRKGVYPQIAKVVDLAPTLTFLLGTVPPSLSEGRVLGEALNIK